MLQFGFSIHSHLRIVSGRCDGKPMSHHLVILKKIYLDRILLGTKTTECRLSETRRAPFQKVCRGDTLWLKQSGGAIRGKARVRSVRYIHPISKTTLVTILKKHRKTIQVDRQFLKRHSKVRYGSLIHLSYVRIIKPILIQKNNQLAWVVLSEPPKPIEKI